MAAVLLSAVPAQADLSETEIESVSPTRIEVGSDGSNYVQVTNGVNVLHMDASVYIHAGFGKVKEWRVWPRLTTEEGHKTELKEHGFKKSYSKKQRVRIVTWDHVPMQAPIANYAVERCNAMADTMRGYGEPNDEIFSREREILVKVHSVLSYEATGHRNEEFSPQEVNTDGPYLWNNIVRVVCQKYEAPSPINVVNLHIEKKESVAGACALDLRTVISTKDKHQQVKYRFEEKNGGTSELHALTTNQHKSGSETHVHELEGHGQKSGQFRVVIEGEDMTSSWMPYNVHCKKPIDATNQFSAEEAKDPNAPILLTDVIAESPGLFIAGNARYWGTQAVLMDQSQASVFGVGPKGDRCLFKNVGFRPYNEGPAHSGPFKAKVFRSRAKAGWKLVESTTFDLKSGTGLPGDGWHKFDVELPEGKSTIKVVLDSGKDVVERNEDNTYLLDVDVKFPCGEDGVMGGPKSVQGAPASADQAAGNGVKKPGPKFGKKLKKLKVNQ